MDWKKASIIVATIPAVILIVYLCVVWYSIAQISVSDVSIAKVHDIGLNGFTINGTMKIQNTGFVSARIDRITYILMLNDTQKNIANGDFPTKDIPAGKSVDIPFDVKLNISMLDPAIIALLFKPQILVDIHANITASMLGFRSTTATHESIDIKEFAGKIFSGK